jgi:thioredoxin reductase (NADPH)
MMGGVATLNDNGPISGGVFFNAEELRGLAEFGTERDVAAGDVLYRAGDDAYDLYVVLEGKVEIVRPEIDGDVVIVEHVGGGFLGELNLLTGQRVYLTARMAEPGRVLAIPPQEFRRLMASKPDLADVIFQELEDRRELLRAGPEGQRTVRIIGSRFSREALALRAFVQRSRIPHEWIEIESLDDVGVFFADLGLPAKTRTPLVITTTGVLHEPTPGDLAEHLGLTFHAAPGYMFDLVVIGVGPAGLAAAIYGASEGLDTVALDSAASGGQAGSSSRIENYVGFPSGISGEELATRAALQALRLGARVNAPCEVAGLRAELGYHVVVLGDGSEIACRSVIIATGARYQRLAVEGLDRFEGNGVYYAATDLEARVCVDSDVVVVGGGNSAGQAAIFLAQQGSRVAIAVRRADLTASMSHYLIERIEADPRITLWASTEVRDLDGDGHLERVTVEHTPTGERREVPCTGLFCFIGADPATDWLDGAIALDDHGFVLTDRNLPDAIARSPFFRGRDPLPFETSLPGVFAVGDVRLGSMKRVAAAVGEGSSAVRAVHEYLALAG